jgi:hypothetical protein
MQNVDKGFMHSVSHFKSTEPVTAAIQVEHGIQGEYGWAVYFEQGRHRCVITGVDSGKPAEEALEDAIWKSCAEWASFQPISGMVKEHVEQVLGMRILFRGSVSGRLGVLSTGVAGTEEKDEEVRGRMCQFNPSDISEEGVGRHATNAASSRRYQLAEPIK